jgi:hypothetical protein
MCNTNFYNEVLWLLAFSSSSAKFPGTIRETFETKSFHIKRKDMSKKTRFFTPGDT